MTGRKAALLTALAAAAALGPAADAQARRGSIYDMTKATGFERITFSGDMDANCLQFNVCGFSGTATYRISGTPKGKLTLTKDHNGRVNSAGTYRTNGVTTSNVTAPPGGEDCTATKVHKHDHFSMLSSGSKNQSLRLTYHAIGGPDYLDTSCNGPSEADADNANALPEGIFSAKDFFRGRKPSFGLAGSTPFQQGGFNATIEWNLKFKARERDCSPKCKLPGGAL
jgi:hypothetical protein